MKYLKIVTAALITLLIAASCKKQSVDSVPTATIKKLQNIVWNNGNQVSQNFTYDNQGRLIKEEDVYTIMTYEYSTNTVFTKEFDKQKNRLVNVRNGITDNAGKIVSFTGTDTRSMNSPFTETGEFTYDANGYLTHYKRTGGGHVIINDLTITDGDFTKLIYRIDGAEFYTQTSNFFADKNALGIVETTFTESNCHNNGLFGKTSTHLLKHNQVTMAGALAPLWENSFTYNLDSDGYIQSVVLAGQSISTGTYTFQ